MYKHALTHAHAKKKMKQAWWCMPIIQALVKLRQEDSCKSMGKLGYIVSSRLAWATQDLVSIEKENKRATQREFLRC